MIEQDTINSKINEIEEYVIQVCGIKEKEKFFSSTLHHYTHARWLYFYAIRHYMHITYANMLDMLGDRFLMKTTQSLTYAVNKMSVMIDSDHEWRQRWIYVRQMCGYDTKAKEEKPKITIVAPNNIEIEIKRKGE